MSSRRKGSVFTTNAKRRDVAELVGNAWPLYIGEAIEELARFEAYVRRDERRRQAPSKEVQVKDITLKELARREKRIVLAAVDWYKDMIDDKVAPCNRSEIELFKAVKRYLPAKRKGGQR